MTGIICRIYRHGFGFTQVSVHRPKHPNMFKVVYFWICFMPLTSSFLNSMDFVKTVKLQNEILANYSKDIRPVKRQTSPVVVVVEWTPLSINSFDEVAGNLVMFSSFFTLWTNEMMTWNASEYPAFYVTFNGEDVWIPKLALANPYSSMEIKKDYEKGTVRCNSDGYQLFDVRGLTSTVCKPDMRFYPFDRHNCSISLFFPDYNKYELTIHSNSTYDNSFLVQVSEWKVLEISAQVTYNYYFSFVTYTVIFRRVPEFIVLNLLAPVLLLCLVNLSVFILPPQSGERISLSVTIFLSFSVYMTIIAEKLPATNPVSYFTYYLFCNLVYSAMILLFTVFGLRFHLDEGSNTAPRWLSSIFLICRKFNLKKAISYKKNLKHDADIQFANKHVYDISSDTSNEIRFPGLNEVSSEEVIVQNNLTTGTSNDYSKSTVTRRELISFIDKFCFAFFFFVFVTGNVVYSIWIYSQSALKKNQYEI